MNRFKNCPYCNQIILDNDVICKYCGREVLGERERTNLPKGNTNSPILTIILLILVFLFIPNVPQTATLNISKYIANIQANQENLNNNVNSATKNFSFENLKNNLNTATESIEDGKNKTKRNYKPDKDIIHTPSYNMSPIEKEVASVMRKKGYKNKAEIGKKVVLYTNVVDLQCPYQDSFLRAIYKYKSHPEWTAKYTFIEVKHHKHESLSYNSIQDAREDMAFRRKCDIFCIIDFSKNQYFSGKTNDTKYLYKALYDLYNQ